MIRPGDVFFLMHHDNLISKVLAWFMRSRWSHSGMIIEVAKSTYVCETSDYEVTVGRLDRYLTDPNVTMEVWTPIEMTDEDREMVVNRCLENVETLYGYLQLISFGIRALLARVGIKIKNFIKQGYVCNENVLSGYVLSKATPFYGIDPKSIETQEMYVAVVGSGKFKRVM